MNSANLSKVLRHFKRIAARWWAACNLHSTQDYVYALGLLIATSLIVAMGPSLQTYISNILVSTEANIYDSAYRNAVQKFPDYAGWLAYLIEPQIILASLVVCGAALSTSRARASLLRSCAAAFLSLTITDLLILSAWQELTPSAFLTSAASNLGGGFLIALLVVSMRSSASYVARYVPGSSLAKVAGMGLPIIIGFAVSGSVFVAAKTMYDPSPASFKATAMPKSWGYYRSDLIKKRIPTSEQPFEIFDGLATKNGPNWLGMSDDFKVNWSSSRTYALSVYLFQGCTRIGAMSSSKLRHAVLSRSGKSLSLIVSDGLSEFGLLPKKEPITLTARDKDLTSFTIEKSENKNPKLSIFASKDAQLTYQQNGAKDIFVSTFLMDKDAAKGAVTKSREVVLTIDGESFPIAFDPAPFKAKMGMACSPILTTLSKRKNHILSSLPISAIVVSLKPPPPDVFLLEPKDLSAKISVLGANGWLTLDTEGAASDGAPLAHGQTDFLVLSGNFSEFQVAGAALPTENTNSLQAFGGMSNISISNDGAMHVDGTANALYWNRERVNKTRWEKMDVTERTLLLTWAAGLIFLGYKGMKISLGKNYELGNPL